MDLFTATAISALAFGPVLLFLGSSDSLWWRRSALIAAALLMGQYLFWRLAKTVPWGDSTAAGVYMQITAVLELAWLVEMVQSHFFFWSAERPVRRGHLATVSSDLDRATVDVFIPTYNEGVEILERTILAARRLVWDGEVRICVLDDGRREWLGELCERYGVRWITRPDNKGAKAGNINHALPQTDGEFILILDADFLAHPHAIRRLMPPMGERDVGITQAPHHFYNQDPIMRTLGTAADVGDDQRLFFDRILPARDRGGFAFFCGTCALIRRSALLAVGGLPSGSVTEDILLSLIMRQRGYETRVIDVPVATGLAPETLRAFFVQRCRWAKGAIQLLYLRTGLLSSRLQLRDRVAFFPAYWILSPILRVSSLMIPQLYLLFAWAPLQNAPVLELLTHQVPLLIAIFALPALLYSRRWSPIVNFVWNDIVALRLFPNVLRDVAVPFLDKRFHVTPKGRGTQGAVGGEWMGVVIVALIVFTLAALIAGPYGRWDDPYVSVSMLWSAVGLTRLLAMLSVVWRATAPVADAQVEARCPTEYQWVLIADAQEIQLDGWWIAESHIRAPDEGVAVPPGRLVQVRGGVRRPIPAKVVAGGALEFANEDARGAFLSILVAMRLEEQTPYRPAVAIGRITRRMFGLQGNGH
ncbi:MAG TPA: glycosyltransferase [Burkholderiales bacterium]|nr:glycosyltransferase [Burkholderiales bacterium]